MIETSFDSRVKIQQIVQNQIPEFLLSESPKAAEFLKQYYISQEYQGGPVDVAENLDQYLKVDNLTQEIIAGKTTLSASITSSSSVINVQSTKGFPSQYGLLKIDNEIITYTGSTHNSFTGCIRGFSGVESYHSPNDPEELVFSTSSAASHNSGSTVTNLSSLFLQEFYNKIKYTFVPGLENVSFTESLDVSNFIKEAKSLYQSKGTAESFKILFRVLYNEDVKVVDLENYLSKPSTAKFSRRENIIAERISGDPLKLVGQTIKKVNDEKTQGSVSEVEIISRDNKNYYKISLFIGYNEKDLTEGTFTITGSTKSLQPVSVGSSIISVDSTLGFPNSGTLISGTNTIKYSSKSVNQFFGCSGITTSIAIASPIRSTEIVYGYEDGDTTKLVELKITGVLSEFVATSDIVLSSEGQNIGVKNLGETIKNPFSNKTFKQVFANSWIYNTSSRYRVSSISGSVFTVLSDIDKSSLKVGDSVDILLRGTQTSVVSNATVTNVNLITKQVTISGLGAFTPSISYDYDIRRNIKKAVSTGAKLEFGNNLLISDIQNVYTNKEYGYVASNSLPSTTITKNILKATISEANGSRLQGLNATSLKYSILSFSSNVPFITGDKIIYSPEKVEIPGLISGSTYYVEVLTSKNQIRLYSSRSFIGTSDAYIEMDSLGSGTGSHDFILFEHKNLIISPQKILRKFSLERNYAKGNATKTLSGPVGLLINGVEIVSPKSEDKIYYGPLTSFSVLNNGLNYDVINPPLVDISSPVSGTKAYVQPVVSGEVKKVFVDPQDFDIDKVISATISGGNGSGAILKPLISKRYREVEFDGRQLFQGGGIDITDDTLSFKEDHYFSNGEKIIYNNNGNLSIGIGTFGPPHNINNKVNNKTLVSGSEYVVQIVNTRTVKLYNTYGDYVSGINTVGFTTENLGGTHKFRTLEKNTLRDIKVLNPGSGYENRKLYVKPAQVSVERDLITFKKHNFKNGDIVNYETTGTPIAGLSTTSSYKVLKYDENSFRLVNSASDLNFQRGKYEKFSSSGSGYHIFKYPNIEITVNVAYGTSSVGIITATPLVRGKIIDAYLYESGTGYGSNVLNFAKKPLVIIKNGKDAEVAPIVKNGRIIQVNVLSGGSEYYSTPDLNIIGDGSGAILRPVVSNQKLVDVVVINSGVNYNQDTTTINVVPAGSGASFDCDVRSLTVNDQKRFEYEKIISTENNLQYTAIGYSVNDLAASFNDDGSSHSPIIGWAYDGNPIYGPYGYANGEDITSAVRLLKPGYILDTTKVENRPSSFDAGFFVEDYHYDNSGDLDVHNGRFCKTPEFLEGTYAYFVGIATDTETNTLKPAYPYFVGETYRSTLDEDNFILNQNFDFNNSDLIRNTFPYKAGDPYADNDFFIESNEIIQQQTLIESITKGSVDSITISEEGDGYKIGEVAIFDNEGTNGSGLSVEISEVKGKPISSVTTTVETNNNTVFIWKDKNTVEAYIQPSHTITNNEFVSVSGLSTSINKLNDTHRVGVTTDTVVLFNAMTTVASPGTVEDISVSTIPPTVSVGSTIQIENELLRVLNIFETGSILRVKRADAGVAHTATTKIQVLPNRIEIPIKTTYFDSALNNVVYFNPKNSVGVGTTVGGSTLVSYSVGGVSKEVSINNQSIYLPNHPFKTGQRVTVNKNASVSAIISSVDFGVSTFNLPISTSDTFYIINKSKDYIGLATQVGLTTNTEGISFLNNGANNYEYFISSVLDQVTGKVERIKSTVSVSTFHGLQNGDIVTLNVKPKIAAGIGNSTSIRITYNQEYDRILVNSVGFASAGISTTTSVITLDARYLKTGDKVFYESKDFSIASGLSTGFYFVYKINDSNIRLSDTFYDTTLSVPNTVTITGVGGSSHQISLVNPQIPVVRNSDLLFDVSDSSLANKKLKIFYDKDFNNEFVAIGNTSDFSLSGVGTIGVAANATFTLEYDDGLPSKLYYTLENAGYISTSDTEVRNNSEIYFTDSAYNGTYVVTNPTASTFTVSLKENPERTSLVQTDHKTLEYYTTSKTTSGGVHKLKTIFGGYNYKSIPKFVGFSSSFGENALLIANSNTIGKINKTRIINAGFEYSSDKTLKPEAYISSILSIEKSSSIVSVEVLDGGKNYNSAPDLIIVDPETGAAISDSSLEAVLTSNSVSSVKVISQPYGLPSTKQNIVPVNNSNGVSISSIRSSSAGIVTCVISTPILGFTTNVFVVGEDIFVEGIEKEGTSGTGFNSQDYEYRYFKVSGYYNTNPAIVEFNLAGIATNAGLAKTEQYGYAQIVARRNLPVFKTTQEFSFFNIGEKLLSNTGTGFVERDLYIIESEKSYIKVDGTYELSVGEIVRGKDSGVLATISEIKENRGFFDISYANRQEYGWSDDIGKLSEASQVLPDNDYYQNLSYSVVSKIGYEDMVDPVNRILHTSGLKNFADKQILSTTDGKVSYASTTNDIIVLDISDDKRVDAINNFAMSIDVDTAANETKSKFIKFKDKKLSDYIKCISNRVLIIDDISGKFSDRGSNADLFVNLDSPDDTYISYLVQVKNPSNLERQITEISLLNDDDNIYFLERGSLSNTSVPLGEIVSVSDSSEGKFVRFVPKDPYDTDYDIKFIKSRFNSNINGIGTQSIGFVNLTGVNRIVGVGTTQTLLSVETNKFNGLYAKVQVIDDVTKEMSYIELMVEHDGVDTYQSDLFFDNTKSQGISTSYIGEFKPSISSGVLSLGYYNDQNNSVLVRANIVGFGSTAIGVGTYRFLSSGQPEGTEQSSFIQSNYAVASGESTVIGIDTSAISSVKSTVRVSYGTTSAIHQVLLVQDGNDIYTTQYPFISVGSTSGIGTFGGEFSGGLGKLKFYPDPSISANIQVQSLNEIIYSENDSVNIPSDLEYGTHTQLFRVSYYDAVNGSRANRLDFDVTSNGIPVYQKTFNPSSSTTLDPVTGIFTIKDHFFSTGEELYYTPSSSFVGVGATGVGIGVTANYAGIVTSILPDKVYAVKLNSDQFRLSTRPEYASVGIYVTFTSVGTGNAHKLEMVKKLDKTIISLNGVVQKPLSFVPISYNVENNFGNVSAGKTYFALSGISSIKPTDFLKIENEFMEVIGVGVGTTNTGPIIGLGTFPIVEVKRGAVGSSTTTLTNGQKVELYRGAYNISGSKIHFSNPPKGNPTQVRNLSNLLYPKTSFNGRVFLRNNYTTNLVYDDISDQFTGIGQTYSLSVQGISTDLTTTGNGVLFLNDIFQTPTTPNNAGNNYEFITDKVSFTGITSSNGQKVISNDDINQNQLPRGGVIVSYGSTNGRGFAPLVGASVTAVLNGSGGVVSVGIGSTDIRGSGYYGNVSIGITDPNHTGTAANITATVGAGGTLAFTVVSSGSGYVNPRIIVPEPSYQNLSVTGVYREGIGATTATGSNLLVTLDVGAVSTTGIGSTLFEVKSFKIARPGYGFRRGDRFKPVGLVTASGLASPLADFELTALDVFTDSFSAWQFGELDYIDSVQNLQNGNRKRFPLYYNGQLLSFEIDPLDTTSSRINLNAVLIIFINGVIQQPGVAYEFTGGSSFIFSDAPKPEDEIAIFFFRGTRGDDSFLVNVEESIKIGDEVELLRNNLNIDTFNQNSRNVDNIPSSDKLETNIYTGPGINETYYRPITWIKQKRDKIINNDYIFKSRDSIETQIYPTAKIIKDISSSTTEIFVDDAQFFNYEENNYGINIANVQGLIVEEKTVVSASATATVSAAGTISGLNVINSGVGYDSAPTVKISRPPVVGVGIGTTATAVANISGGVISLLTVVNPGYGYTLPPQVIISTPTVKTEKVTNITTVEGFSGIVTGITTTNNSGQLALKFFIQGPNGFTGLNANYPIYIKDTNVGTGLTSVYSNNSDTIAISTSYVDNVYSIDSISVSGTNAVIITNIHSNTSVVGVATTGTSNSPVGKYSWGKLSGITRSSSPVSIGVSGLTADNELTNYPSIQRKGFGLRDLGAIRKQSSV